MGWEVNEETDRVEGALKRIAAALWDVPPDAVCVIRRDGYRCGVDVCGTTHEWRWDLKPIPDDLNTMMVLNGALEAFKGYALKTLDGYRHVIPATLKAIRETE